MDWRYFNSLFSNQSVWLGTANYWHQHSNENSSCGYALGQQVSVLSTDTVCASESGYFVTFSFQCLLVIFLVWWASLLAAMMMMWCGRPACCLPCCWCMMWFASLLAAMLLMNIESQLAGCHDGWDYGWVNVMMIYLIFIYYNIVLWMGTG